MVTGSDTSSHSGIPAASVGPDAGSDVHPDQRTHSNVHVVYGSGGRFFFLAGAVLVYLEAIFRAISSRAGMTSGSPCFAM